MREFFPSELPGVIPPSEPFPKEPPRGPVPREPPARVPPAEGLAPRDRPRGANTPSPFRGATPAPRN